jgi:hypothetical protein
LAPSGSSVDVKLATAVESGEAVPSVVAPLVNVTVPVGVELPKPEAAYRVATSSIGNPCVELDADAAKDNVVGTKAAVTVRVAEVDVDAVYEVFPAYSAVRLCAPTANVVLEYVACPELFSVAVARLVVPS